MVPSKVLSGRDAVSSTMRFVLTLVSNDEFRDTCNGRSATLRLADEPRGGWRVELQEVGEEAEAAIATWTMASLPSVTT